MNNLTRDNNTLKKVLFALISIIIIVAILILRKDYQLLSLFRDMEKLKEYILSFGNLAPLIFGFIQFLQVIISPVPGNITTVVGGAVFGFWQSLIISSIAIILGSIAAFGLARAFGRPFVEWIIGKERVSEYFDKITRNRKIIFVLIILLPFFPDDIICLIAGISGMTWGFFILTMLIARPPGLIVSALVGSHGFEMPIWVWIVIFIIILLVLFAYNRVKKIIDKRSE